MLPSDLSRIILLQEKLQKNKQKQLKNRGEQAEALKVLDPDTQQLSTKDFISKNQLNSEIGDKLKRIKNVGKKLI